MEILELSWLSRSASDCVRVEAPDFLVNILTRSISVGIRDNDGGRCEGTYILIPLTSNPIGNTTIYEFIEGYHLSTLPLALIPLSLFPLKTYF